MEVQNKEKTAKPKNKRKFSFENLKIRNKIIFGFFIVSIIFGLANYYSNLFIVNEFRSANNTMYLFHNIFAMQKKLEIMAESYVASETKESVSDLDYDTLHKQIEKEFGEFMRVGGAFLEKDLISRFVSESGSFFEKEYEVVAAHKKEMEARNIMAELQEQENEKRYEIKKYVDSLADGDIYAAFLYAEYQSKEMLYQYKDSDHAKGWLESLDKVKVAAENKKIDIPGFDEYYDIAFKASESVVQADSIDQEERKKLEEFRFSIKGLNAIQDEISRAIITQNLREIDAIVVVGVFVFIFILIFFTVLFGYIISSFISRPIKELAEFALMAGKGNFRRRMNINTDDEIGQTAKAFNLMLDKVEESTEVLEAKVNARTKRLEELSQSLETQINNKTKELNEKIGELERFNDLAVGRELRMMELKREMEILRQGNGASELKKPGKKKKNPNAKSLNC